MRVQFKGLGTILKKTFKGWNEDDPFRQSAVIAYYAIFSLPALLVLIINVVGFFFEKEAINGEISRQITGVMGEDTAESVEKIVAKAGEMKGGLIPGIIAVVTIIIGATGVFIQLQKTLNQIWDVQQKPNQGFMIELRHRLFSFGLILSIGFLMLTSLVISSVLAAVSHWFEGIFPEVIAYLFYALEFAFSLLVISTLFLLMFKFLPDVRMAWKDLMIGAVLTGLLFMIGKYALSFYFGKAEPASVYGAAGSVILMLLWVSYSSMILFFGAEFTKQYAVYHGIHIEPTKIAEKVKDGEAKNASGDPVKTGSPDPASSRTEKKTESHMTIKQHSMKKITTKQELAEEITRLEARAEIQKLVIKEKLRPAQVVKDILSKRKTIQRPDNKELAMEGFEFAINYLTDHVLFKNANETVKSLSVYAMRELARNYVYGRAASWSDHLKELLNITQRVKLHRQPFRRMEDPVDEYYENM